MRLRRSAARLPWPVLAIAAVAVAFGLLVHSTSPGDATPFFAGGKVLLSRHCLDAFANPQLQVGPLQLLLYGVVAHVAHAIGVGRATMLSVVVQAGAALLVTGTALALLHGRELQRVLAFAAGLVVVVTGITLDAFESGHPANVWIPLAWIAAGLAARRDRPALAGALVGLGCGVEVWSLLGAPVLFLAPRPRRVAVAVGWMLGVVAVLFVPFALGGEFHMLDFRWLVASGTPVSLVLGSGTHFGWPLRLVQGAAAAAAALGVVRLARGSIHAVWLVPLAIALVRLLLDPQLHPYYFLEVATPAIVGAALLASVVARRKARPPAPGPL
jgi:hypothetical protein